MQSFSFGATGRSTTSLGFGCAGLMRPSSEAERQALLTTAYDVGIRHFDVARYYGHGQAEAVLGEFIANTGCRDSVTIATKFGLQPPPMGHSSPGRLIMNLARKVASIHPTVRKILSARAGAAVKKNCFDVATAKASLETSLRELRTDRIDLFLLHEATLEDTKTDGLLEFLEEAIQTGKICAYGLASDFPLVPPIIRDHPSFTQVVQISNGPGQWNRRKLPAEFKGMVNTHGALKILPKLEKALQAAPSEATQIWKELGSPAGDDLAGLILAMVMHDNPQGITLFSSIQPQRIRGNIEAARQIFRNGFDQWLEVERCFETALADAALPVG